MRHRYMLAACAAATCLLAGCQAGSATTTPAAAPSASPTSVVTSSPTIDWRNATYRLRCESDTTRPSVTVALHGGKGSVPGYVVEAGEAATGDLTGDGTPEVAVLLTCSPDGSNYSTDEIVVLGAGPKALGSLPAEGGLSSPTAFTQTTLAIADGRLTVRADELADGQCRACGPPSVHVLYEWRWSNGAFVGGRH